MAKQKETKESAVEKLWKYLISQGILGYEFPTYDTAYMNDVAKLYENMILYNPTIEYDSVTPKYENLAMAGDPVALQVGEWLRDIEYGKSPDQIISEQGVELNDTIKDDLKRYASEKYARDKASFEFNYKAGGSAELYGLPDPSSTFELPPGIVKDLIRMKDGKTPEEAASRELLAVRQRAESDLKKRGKKLSTSRTVVGEPTFSEDPAANVFNKGIDFLNFFNKGFTGTIASGLPGFMRPSTRVDESNKITRPKEVPIPSDQQKYGGAVGGMISALERLKEVEAEGEIKLQEALTRQIMEKFGTPYAAATKEAARIAASRKKGASGNWPQ
jgi:hypothetical protein